LEAVEKMSLDAMPKTTRRGVGDLMSFKDEAKSRREETERLQMSNQRLQQEVDGLKRRLENAERARPVAETKLADDGANGRQLRQLEMALAEAQEENSKRVSETSQFQQMRRLMQSQSAKIQGLRSRLERYEPDVVKEEDD